MVDSTQLARYKALLIEEGAASVQNEPEGLTLYAVFEQKRPHHLTILERYATEAAYQAHVKTELLPGGSPLAMLKEARLEVA